MRHKTRLNAEWIKAKIKLRVKDNVELAKVNSRFIPRWARINTLRITQAVLLAGMSDFKVVQSLQALAPNCVYVDEHIHSLLAFSPDQNLTNHKYYIDGSLIIQNKASCIPAAVLAPPPGATVIDACAAPGNKTTHLAALLGNNGKLFAFERDNKRVMVLRNMLQKAGAKTEVIHGDFTRSDPHDAQFAQVSHLLLDPSCSGSGIVNRLDYLTQSVVNDKTSRDTAENDHQVSSTDQDRLDALSSFQLALLLHAMKFPAAEKITYSTCSIHAIENEHVVIEALRKAPKGWQLCRRAQVLPDWPHRGNSAECGGNEDLAQGLIRAVPGEMGTIGFFVACFERRTVDSKRKHADTALFVKEDDEERGVEQHDNAEGLINQAANEASKKKNKRRKKTKNMTSMAKKVETS